MTRIYQLVYYVAQKCVNYRDTVVSKKRVIEISLNAFQKFKYVRCTKFGYKRYYNIFCVLNRKNVKNEKQIY